MILVIYVILKLIILHINYYLNLKKSMYISYSNRISSSKIKNNLILNLHLRYYQILLEFYK